MTFHTGYLSHSAAFLRRLLIRCGGRRLWACPSPTGCKGTALLSSFANLGELQLYICLMFVQFLPCIPVQSKFVSLTRCLGPPWLPSALSTPTTPTPLLSVRHLNLGMEGRRVQESSCTGLFPFLCQDLILSFNGTMKALVWLIPYYSSIFFHYSLDTQSLC